MYPKQFLAALALSTLLGGGGVAAQSLGPVDQDADFKAPVTTETLQFNYPRDPDKIVLGVEIGAIGPRVPETVSKVLRKGDIVVAADDITVTEDWELYAASALKPTTDTLKLTVMRDGKLVQGLRIPGGPLTMELTNHGNRSWKRWLLNSNRDPHVDDLVWSGYNFLDHKQLIEGGKALEEAVMVENASDPTLFLRLGMAVDGLMKPDDPAGNEEVLQRSEDLFARALVMTLEGRPSCSVGLIYAQLGKHGLLKNDMERAHAMFNRALTLNPRDPLVILNVYTAMVEAGWKAERIALLDRLIADPGVHPRVIFNLADHEVMPALKIKMMQAYIERMGGNDVVGQISLARVQSEISGEEALATLDKLTSRYDKDLAPGGKASYHSARLLAYARLKNYDAAEAEFLKGIVWDPYLDGEDAYQMFRLADELNRPKDAVRWLMLSKTLAGMQGTMPGRKNRDLAADIAAVQKKATPADLEAARKAGPDLLKRIIQGREAKLSERGTPSS